jgi:hypothetical protein
MQETTESRATIALVSPKVVATGADTSSPASIAMALEDPLRNGWQDLIDSKLIKWLQDPTQLGDEGSDPPAGKILRLAIDYAEKFRDELLAPPTSVVPDANGGIVFERRQDNISEVFHFWDDGALEYLRFQGTKLVERNSV